MVERPIKKSERPAIAESQGGAEGAESTGNRGRDNSRSEERGGNRSSRGKGDKGDKKRRGKRDQEQEERPPVNPALMRGPKPVQIKPLAVTEEAPVEAEADEEPAVESEAAAE